MKKKIEDNDKNLRKLIHSMVNDAEDYVEKHELDSFLDKRTNDPDVSRMEADPDLEVGDVLMIGGFLALSKLHHEMHKQDAEDVVEGNVDIRVVMPDDVPPEVMEALDQFVKKMKKGKK